MLARNAKQRLRKLGLRPTRPRLQLLELLMELGPQHLSASEVHHRLCANGSPVSLATVYNNLNDFVEVGHLRRISLRNQTLFDTNTTPHHHIIDSSGSKIVDTDAIDYILKDNFPSHARQKIVSVEITVTMRSPS
jgi:Fur family transcriptional regulator, iron response regulator